MERYDRSKIVEERIQNAPEPVIDGDTGQKIQYLQVLVHSKTRKPGVIDADLIQDAARHIRIQQQIRKDWQIKTVSEMIVDGDNRVSLRRLK